jgi:hypothetical protein
MIAMDYAILKTNKGIYFLKGNILDSIYERNDSDYITIEGIEHEVLEGTQIGSEPIRTCDSDYEVLKQKPNLSRVMR